MIAIKTANLSKSYDGKVFALQNLNLSVEQGDVCGFLGPNGAGKTTTVKLLNGLLTPTKGECEVMGISPIKDPCGVHSVCGVMTESAKMYGQMTGMENLLFFAQVNQIPVQAAQDRATELLKELGIWDARDKKLSAYSTGMAQRLSMARALINRPQVLFLDEPTSGLDPESAQAVNDLITRLAKSEGTTVFLCTHQLRYAQDICNCYGLINKGSLMAFGDFNTLCSNIECRIQASIRLKDGDTLKDFTKNGDWWNTKVLSEEQMPQILKQLIEQGHDIYEARLIKPTLEDVYFGYFGTEQGAQL